MLGHFYPIIRIKVCQQNSIETKSLLSEGKKAFSLIKINLLIQSVYCWCVVVIDDQSLLIFIIRSVVIELWPRAQLKY